MRVVELAAVGRRAGAVERGRGGGSTGAARGAAGARGGAGSRRGSGAGSPVAAAQNRDAERAPRGSSSPASDSGVESSGLTPSQPLRHERAAEPHDGRVAHVVGQVHQHVAADDQVQRARERIGREVQRREVDHLADPLGDGVALGAVGAGSGGRPTRAARAAPSRRRRRARAASSAPASRSVPMIDTRQSARSGSSRSSSIASEYGSWPCGAARAPERQPQVARRPALGDQRGQHPLASARRSAASRKK